MPHVIAHAMTSCTQCAMHTCRHAGCHPYDYVVHQNLLTDLPFTPAESYISKLTTSHFNTLKTQIANQNMLVMLLIAMQDENKADCNENFRMCREICGTSVHVVDFIRPVGTELSQLQI